MNTKIYDKAVAVWHLANPVGNTAFPYEFAPWGPVSYVALEGEEREESLRRGGDGCAALFTDNAYLCLHRYRARRLRPKKGKLSLYVRAFLPSGGFGPLFFSENVCLSTWPGGLVEAHLGVKVRGGSNFREIPLCFAPAEGWLDLVLTVGDGEIVFYLNGVCRSRLSLNQELCAPFDEDLLLGAFQCSKPDTYGNGAAEARIASNSRIDTVALWHEILTPEEVASLSGVEKIVFPPLDTARDAFCRLQSAFYDASVEGDVTKCQALSKQLYALARQDPARPVYHLTQPFGFLFDPCGAFYHQGRYHVFSYHNIFNWLQYSSLDHYVSDDLVHWEMWPIAPFTDSDADKFCIYLLNHFYDENGDLRTLYTGQGVEGKCGVLARTEDMVTYTDKHVVLSSYHHDGHVFRHEGKWYTITSLLARATRPGDLGDPVMLWSSPDLEQWTEEGEIFTATKSRHAMGGFMEFPYLVPFGDRTVLIMGTKPVQYWVGDFDWKQKKFLPDCVEGKNLDLCNPFPCFNPSCVDHKGENGAERRLLMVLFPNIGSNADSDAIWFNAHCQPRVLSLEGDHLRQDPLPELAACRRSEASWQNVTTSPEGIVLTQGDCLELDATFAPSQSGRFGLRLFADSDGDNAVSVWFDASTRQFGVSGAVDFAGEGPSYLPAEKPVRFQVFVDRRLIEVFVNGQSAATAARADIASSQQAIGVFGEGQVCTSFQAWQMDGACETERKGL